MNEDEIKQGIQLICDTSKEMSRYYNDKDALIDKLNSLDKDDLAPLENEFKTPGPVVDLRKEVLKYLLERKKLDEQTFESFIHKHRTGNEKKFAPVSEFVMFEQFITPYRYEPIRKFIDQLSDEIIRRLQLNGKVKHRNIDFQGRPHLGVLKFSLAIYNSRQESQSASLQMLVEFQDCTIKYGIKRQLDKNYIKGPEEKNSINFDFESLISFFEENNLDSACKSID
jgi:5-methylcytosine-specific restriction enzyme B